MIYRIEFIEEAKADLKAIEDQRSQQAISSKINDLQTEPEKRGKPLTDELKGCYSVRAAGQRYRVIYRIKVTELKPTEGKEKEDGPKIDRVVTVLVIGIRKEGSKYDVYEVARKRLG